MRRIKLLLAVVILVAASTAIVLFASSFWFMVMPFLAIYILVGSISESKGIENIWVSVLVSLILFPLNIAIEIQLFEVGIINLTYGVVGRTVTFLLIYFILFSLEQIAAGILARLIWRKQLFDDFKV